MERKEVNKDLAQMLKGGVIMDVTNNCRKIWCLCCNGT